MATTITLSENGNTAFEKLIGHNPFILQKWRILEDVLFTRTNLSADLLEQVRRTLAFENECEYCMVKSGRPDINNSDKQMRAATDFAYMFSVDHKSIAEGHFAMLKEVFTEEQISALCVFISFITASQKFGKIMNLTEEQQVNKSTTMHRLKTQSNLQ